MRLVPNFGGAVDFCFHAEDLATAIWMQFAIAVAGNKEYGYCAVCGKPFEASPEVARTNRIFCGVNCRLRAYRKRQKEAVRLREAGKSLREIANVLESDISTVKGWIESIGAKE
jgi:hypothetical protein